MISVSVQGVDKLLSALERTSTQVERKTINAVTASAFRIQASARRDAPVDTGRLRSAIFVRFLDGGRSADVGTDVHYGKYHEFGTRFMAPRPFLRPAYESERPKLLARLRGILAGGS